MKIKKAWNDESWVWFTGMGLVIGLLMILWLLGLVATQGLGVFWPREIEKITQTDGTVFLGERVLAQTKKDLTTGKLIEEEQFFNANKDRLGQPFRFVDVPAIASRERATGALRLERMEYGPVLAHPVSLTRAGGAGMDASHPGFKRSLEEALHEARGVRARIKKIEKGEIGRINAAIEDLRIEKKGLEGRREKAALAGKAAELKEIEAKIGRIDEKILPLQKSYEEKAEEARGLREAGTKASLSVRHADGSVVDIPVQGILEVTFPNELGWFGKLGRFFAGIWDFLSEDPREANTEGGVFPAIFGTFVMTLLMSIAVMPFGVVAAIYLREYAKQGFLVRSVRIAVNNLAGVPSIVFGVFGLGFFVYVLGGSIDQLLFSNVLPTPTFGTGGVFWASLTLALMTVPVVIVSTEESLAAVPRGTREGALALGSSKWQTIRSVVMPAAAPGMLTGLILAMARGAGEVAPLMLVGVVKLAPALPIDGQFPFVHLERKFMHLGFHIYDLGFQSPDSESAKPMVFATTLLLIALVVGLNLAAILLRQHLRKKYATGAF